MFSDDEFDRQFNRTFSTVRRLWVVAAVSGIAVAAAVVFAIIAFTLHFTS